MGLARPHHKSGAELGRQDALCTLLTTSGSGFRRGCKTVGPDFGADRRHRRGSSFSSLLPAWSWDQHHASSLLLPSPSGPRGCRVSSWPGDMLSTHGPLWPELWGKVGAGALGYIGPGGPLPSPWPVGLPSATRSLLILRIPLPPDLNLCPTLGLIFPLDISKFLFCLCPTQHQLG